MTRDTFEIKKNIELNDSVEMEIEFEVSYFGGERPSRDSPGAPAEVEVLGVTGVSLFLAESQRSIRFKDTDEAFIFFMNNSDEEQEQLFIEVEEIIADRKAAAEDARIDTILERQELEYFENWGS